MAVKADKEESVPVKPLSRRDLIVVACCCLSNVAKAYSKLPRYASSLGVQGIQILMRIFGSQYSTVRVPNAPDIHDITVSFNVNPGSI
eukprot:5252588-Pyramimonas_sp.AAC.1